jgi:hypothetical protein
LIKPRKRSYRATNIQHRSKPRNSPKYIPLPALGHLNSPHLHRQSQQDNPVVRGNYLVPRGHRAPIRPTNARDPTVAGPGSDGAWPWRGVEFERLPAAGAPRPARGEFRRVGSRGRWRGRGADETSAGGGGSVAENRCEDGTTGLGLRLSAPGRYRWTTCPAAVSPSRPTCIHSWLRGVRFLVALRSSRRTSLDCGPLWQYHSYALDVSECHAHL